MTTYVEEYMHISFAIDEHLKANVDKLAAEGWDLKQNTPPIAVYHLVRKKLAEIPPPEPPKDPELPSSLGKLLINDALITILGPDGKPK